MSFVMMSPEYVKSYMADRARRAARSSWSELGKEVLTTGALIGVLIGVSSVLEAIVPTRPALVQVQPAQTARAHYHFHRG